MSDIRKELALLRKQQEQTHKRWIEAKNDYFQLGKEISALLEKCPRRSGKKHAGGGGGLGGQFWLKCDGCGENHVITKEEFDSYPGKITWHSTGN